MTDRLNIDISNEASDDKTNDLNEVNQKKAPERTLLYDIIAFVIKIGWIGLVFLLIFKFMVGIMVNHGDRMSPAFSDSDLIAYYRLADEFEVGDCVVYVGEENSLLLGRVVAKEGDTVDITSEGVMVNGYYRTENYAKGDTVLFEGGVEFPITLSQGEYFVLADDRSQGSDSRNYGALSTGIIRGRVLISIRWRNF